MLLVQQLHDFLVRTGQTREEFAVQMGVNPSLLSRLIPPAMEARPFASRGSPP